MNPYIEIDFRKPLFCYNGKYHIRLRNKYLKRARTTGKTMKIITPKGTGYYTYEEWMKGAKKQGKKSPAMRFGVHTSIAGGLYKAVLRGDELGCDVIQIFSTNPNQWKPRRLGPEEIARFKEAVSGTGIEPVMTHSSYLINMGSPSKEQERRFAV